MLTNRSRASNKQTKIPEPKPIPFGIKYSLSHLGRRGEEGKQKMQFNKCASSTKEVFHDINKYDKGCDWGFVVPLHAEQKCHNTAPLNLST